MARAVMNLLLLMIALATRSAPFTVRAIAMMSRCKRPSFVVLQARQGGGVSNDTSITGAAMIPVEPMENLYREWTLEQDKLLWENRKSSTAELASLLGRGLRGVESRLAKLKDVQSSAYERLFAEAPVASASSELEESIERIQTEKLVPVSEVLRRIQWDDSLPAEKFSILHYDRVEDTIVESPFTETNTSIKGPKELLVDALPEHRIVAVKYLDRRVWDREKRIDRVFSNEGIMSVMENYEEWKRKRDEVKELNRQKQRELVGRIQQILGFERFAAFQDLSSALQSKATHGGASGSRLPTKPRTESIPRTDVELFVAETMALFRQARKDTSSALGPVIIPRSDYESLDFLSELVALLPDATLRPMILSEISLVMRGLEGKKAVSTPATIQDLPEINEHDLKETFVRGKGPGGQKINKTSNRVVLVHMPTQIIVECQDTRSLHQNRKIARKRLRLKLDEYLNGSQSRESLKAQKASSKKAKVKARSRARNRRKSEEADEEVDEEA